MRALIMAGGAGSRLGQGEKPLALVCGRPMIAYVLDAFRSAGCEPVVAVSKKTPMTANWCRANGITIIRACGDGFVSDMVLAVRQMEEKRPLFVSVSDIPGITPAVIATILKTYERCGKDALSTWVPATRVTSCGGGISCHRQFNGVDGCPAGVNILRGDCIDREQDEFALLIDDACLALNVNTPEDLARAGALLAAGPVSALR